MAPKTIPELEQKLADARERFRRTPPRGTRGAWLDAGYAMLTAEKRLERAKRKLVRTEPQIDPDDREVSDEELRQQRVDAQRRERIGR
jgi:hypothetical protein